MFEKLNLPSMYMLLSYRDIYEAGYLSEDDIIKIDSFFINEYQKKFKYKVLNNNVEITIDFKNKNVNYFCDCNDFHYRRSCKHIAAVLTYDYEKMILGYTEEEKNINLTNLYFQYFKKRETEKQVKKELFLEIDIGYDGELALKVGYKKLYILKGSKLKIFKDLYINNIEGDYEIGKDFVYNYKNYYFNEKTKKVLDYALSISNHKVNDYGISSKYFIEESNRIFDLAKMCIDNDIGISINKVSIYKISNDFPINTVLDKKGKNYILKINIEDRLNYVNGNRLIFYNHTLYYLSNDQAIFINALLSDRINELSFNEVQKDKFISTLLPLVKTNISINENADIKISKEINSLLYFDILENMIICNLKFKYDNEEIDYFDNSNELLRDKEYEDSIIESLLSYGFKINDNKIYLDDIDLLGEFVEKGLIELTNKYDVFTSEKLKNTNIIKKSNIRSIFSIGQDNIMSYSFDLGDIKPSEINNILSSYKNKKKYYKLKSGDIINLEDNDDLRELNELQEELNLSNSDIKNGGVIPKYRAIYLDSVKNDKYHIIETNNLFDNLINQFKNYKDINIKLKKEDKEILRDYQEYGVKWLYNIDKSGFGGILADEMGLGKSIQTIYYIKELLKEDKNNKFLIVTPTSLAYNWENEFNKFGKEIKYKVMLGIKDKRVKYFDEIDNYNVLITTYGLLREDSEYYEKITFRSMIIDEAQAIKNPTTSVSQECKKINATTKIALTGTPIENNIVELWSIFDFIMPGLLYNVDKFNKKYKIKEFDEEGNKKLNTLNKIVSPFILRRRKKDVIKELPDKIENNIYIELGDKQKLIYLTELERVRKEIDNMIHIDGINKVRFLILKLLTRLRQICISPKIVYEEFNDESSKIEELVKIVNELKDNNRKCLIFTSFRTAQQLCKERFDKEGITYYTIDGATPSKTRMDLVNKFNEDDTNVFFIMLKAGGNGLNLTGADAVIHLDLWWNPQVENQATDRAHRIGQKHVVDVIRLITKGTIEEKILDLQNKKRLLAEKLIDGDNNPNAFNELTEEDIKELLSVENRDN